MSKLFPTTLTAGVTLQTPVTLTAYSPDDWSMAVYLRGPAAIDLAATPDAGQFLIAADATTTATWLPGHYWYSMRVTDGVTIEEVEEGNLQIVPDLATVAAGFDGRNHVQRVLDAIEAVIEGRASKDQQSYKINNRELQRTPITDLLTLRSQYQTELRRQKLAKNGQSLLGRNVKVRFR